METPDFEVRKLSEYNQEDLSILFRCVDFSRKALYPTNEKEYGVCDVWMYRLRDAIKEAKKRESEN